MAKLFTSLKGLLTSSVLRGLRSVSKGAKRNKLGNVWVFVQLVFGPGWSMNQLYKNLNIVSFCSPCSVLSSNIKQTFPVLDKALSCSSRRFPMPQSSMVPPTLHSPCARPTHDTRQSTSLSLSVPLSSLSLSRHANRYM